MNMEGWISEKIWYRQAERYLIQCPKWRPEVPALRPTSPSFRRADLETRINWADSCPWAENASIDILWYLVESWNCDSLVNPCITTTFKFPKAMQLVLDTTRTLPQYITGHWVAGVIERKSMTFWPYVWLILDFLETTQDMCGWWERAWQAVAIKTAHAHIGAPEIWRFEAKTCVQQLWPFVTHQTPGCSSCSFAAQIQAPKVDAQPNLAVKSPSRFNVTCRIWQIFRDQTDPVWPRLPSSMKMW